MQYAAVQGAWSLQEDVLAGLARRAGSRLAAVIVCLADGNRAHWTVLERLFPGAVYLLDWFHLQQHLSALVTLLGLPPDWLPRQQEALLARGPWETLRALAGLVRHPGWSDEQAEGGQRCFGSVWHNRQRMGYAAARRQGYPIGSGRIESAIKQVLQARAKGPGMRWAHDHLQVVLNARCAELNGDWELACAQTRAAARSLPPGARPIIPPYRLRVPATDSAEIRPSRRTQITVPQGAGMSERQLARVFREAFGS